MGVHAINSSPYAAAVAIARIHQAQNHRAGIVAAVQGQSPVKASASPQGLMTMSEIWEQNTRLGEQIRIAAILRQTDDPDMAQMVLKSLGWA